MDEVPDRALTHAGVFHADDVFAAALLTILNPRVELVRANAVPQGYSGLVFDIGGGEFDHHGTEPRLRPNGVPYASFGLLWACFAHLLVDPADADPIDAELVQPIDAADNGAGPCMVTRLVSDFNPPAQATPADFDRAFGEAVTWACGVLERRLARVRRERADACEVEERMRACDGDVLVLERYVPWKGAVVGSGYLYVVYPSAREGYNVQAVPPPGDPRGMVLPFPEEWRGRAADELRRLTGVDDFMFCHASGFLCVASSLEGALRLAGLAAARKGGGR